MSQVRRPSASAAQMEQQAQRLRSFRALLDPIDLLPGHNVADLYSLRHLCLQSGGVPDSSSASADGWLRAQAWRVLLGYLTPEKLEWSATLEKRRGEYYQFVADFLPGDDESSSSGSIQPERDSLLDQIFRDLIRSRKNAFAFYREEVKPSQSCPLAPSAEGATRSVERLAGRHSILRRLERINTDYADIIQQERLSRRPVSGEREVPKSDSLKALAPEVLTTPVEETSQKPYITLQPASPGAAAAAAAAAATANDFIDRRWHSLLRILYIYALLNPSMGYVQGMNEVLFVLLYVLGTSSVLPRSPAVDDSDQLLQEDVVGAHAEADAFWCFSALIGEMRELYDFEGIDHASARLVLKTQRDSDNLFSGMGSQLRHFSLRLRWLDDELWRALRDHSLDPRLPYYSFRWLACILSTELSLPSVVRLWDALLAESSPLLQTGTTPKVDFLIDICCALLINVRGPLLDAVQKDNGEDAFSRAMDILQSYPDDDVGPIVETACLFRQRRLAAPLTGDGPRTTEEDETQTIRDRALHAFREWRTPSGKGRVPGDESITSSASPSWKRYAEAFQTSDAAANLSKVSTNWQAKAMATWNGARGTPTRQGQAIEDVHPALRWSRDSIPAFAHPTMLDSSFEKRASTSRRESFSSSSADAEQHTPSDSLSRFAHLPSLQHAAAAGVRGGLHASPQGSSNGVKPLLLQNAARPPREHSNNGSVMGDEPTSRKVSSGPMAANVSPSPRGSGFGRRRNDNMSSSGTMSRRESSRTSASLASRSQDSPFSGTGGGDELSTLQALRNDDSSTSDFFVRNPQTPPMPTEMQQFGAPSPPPPPPPKATIAAASFFEKKESNDVPLSFGQAASSGNVPLTQKSSLQRHRARKSSTSTLATEPDTKDEDSPAPSTPVLGSSTTHVRPRGPRAASIRQSYTFENPRSAPVPPLEDPVSAAGSGKSASGSEGGVTRSRRTLSGKRGFGVGGRPSSGGGKGPPTRRSTQEELSDENDAHAIPRRLSNRLAVIAPGETLAIESGTSVTPSPGPEEGKMVQADELMELLQQEGTTYERKHQLLAERGISEQQLQAMTASSNTADQANLLSPRAQRAGFLLPPSDGASEGGATSGEDEFYDAGGTEDAEGVDAIGHALVKAL